MPSCKQCQNKFPYIELSKGICKTCSKISEAEEQQSLLEIEKIVLTTETHIDFNIEKRLEVITAECVFGMNVFKDLFASMSDFFGGRSKSAQKVLQDARKLVLLELKKEAYSLGANAVIAIDLDYSEISGGGKSMLFVVASGTAVKCSFE